MTRDNDSTPDGEKPKQRNSASLEQGRKNLQDAYDALVERAGVEKVAGDPNSKPISSEERRQLTFWPDEVRALPNPMLRSALFAVIRPGRRGHLKQKLLSSRRDVRITFTGQQLDQADADVYMQLLHIARLHPIGDIIHINRAEILRAIGRSTGETAYLWLESVIDRLFGGYMDIETKHYKFSLRLIADRLLDKKNGEYWFKMDARTVDMFRGDQLTYIDMDKRRALGRNANLAKWLLGYASTHKAAMWHRIDAQYLREWSGYEGTRDNKWRESLVLALNKCMAVGGLQKARLRDDGVAEWYRPRFKKVSPDQAAAMLEDVEFEDVNELPKDNLELSLLDSDE